MNKQPNICRRLGLQSESEIKQLFETVSRKIEKHGLMVNKDKIKLVVTELRHTHCPSMRVSKVISTTPERFTTSIPKMNTHFNYLGSVVRK